MKLSDLRGLDRDDVLRMIGLQQRRSTGAAIAAGAGLFSAGLLLGAGVALLLAPKPGSELRDDLRERLKRGSKDAEDVASSVLGREENNAGSSKTY
jgi:gas vesicle protein